MIFKADVYIVKLDKDHLKKLFDSLVEESNNRLSELTSSLSHREELTIPVPCALEVISKITKEDEMLRLVQLVKKYDAKRVKEIVAHRAKQYHRNHPELAAIPEAVISELKTEVKEEDSAVQIPKVVDMILMFYGSEILMHSGTNIASFKPYILNLINEPAIFYPAYCGVEESEWDELLECCRVGHMDGSKFIFDEQVNQCNVTLFAGSYNRIKLKSTRQLTPHIIYETWMTAIKRIKETQNAPEHRTL